VLVLERQIAQIEALQRQRNEDDRRTAPKPSPTRKMRLGPWVLTGTGLLLLGVAGAFGALASSRHDKAVAEPDASRAEELQGTAERYAVVTNVLLACGGASALGGLVWLAVDIMKDKG